MGTTTKGYRYPEPTDPVAQGADAIKNLALDVDARAGAAASGTVSLTPTALNAPVSAAITFPAGRFTVPPNVVTTVVSGNPHQFASGQSGVTAAGFTLYLVQTGGTLTARQVAWSAHQP